MRHVRSISLVACHRDRDLVSMMSARHHKPVPAGAHRRRHRGVRPPQTLVLLLPIQRSASISTPHPVAFDTDFGAQSNPLRPHKVGVTEFDS